MTRLSKGFALIFLLITIGLIEIAGIGYLVYKKGQTRKENPPATKNRNYTPTPFSTEIPFSVDYPSKYTNSTTSDIANNPDILLSIESWKYFPNTVLRTTNMFQVLKVPNIKTPEDCYINTDNQEALTLRRTINGEVFYYTKPYGGAAAGTHDTNEQYKTFRNNTCYQVNLIHLESSDWNNPIDVDLAKDDIKESFNELHQILSTFRFTDKGSLTPTCRPRPACLDETPRCLIPETEDMCPAKTSSLTPAPTPSSLKSGCMVGGCSGEICSEEERFSPCIYIPKNECYKTATCEKQSNGKCGWTQSEELTLCLNKY